MSRFSGVCDLYDYIYSIGADEKETEDELFNKFYVATGGVIYKQNKKIEFEKPSDLVFYYDYEIASMSHSRNTPNGTYINLASMSENDRRIEVDCATKMIDIYKEDLQKEYIRLVEKESTTDYDKKIAKEKVLALAKLNFKKAVDKFEDTLKGYCTKEEIDCLLHNWAY